jgi:hypothetical protein
MVTFWVPLVLPDLQEVQDLPGHQVRMDHQELRGLTVHQELQDLTVRQELQDPAEAQVAVDQQDLAEHPEHQGLKELQVLLDLVEMDLI